MASPFPFTSGQVLTAAELNEIGDWIDYSGTQTFTGLTVGNGTLSSYYTAVNDVVYMRGRFILGSTSGVTGAVDMTIPITNAVTTLQDWTGHNRFFDQSASAYYAGALVSIGTTTYRLTRFVVSGSEIVNGDLGSAAPFTWTTGDEISWSFHYQAA